jgi:hypothetical protein
MWNSEAAVVALFIGVVFCVPGEPVIELSCNAEYLCVIKAYRE